MKKNNSLLRVALVLATGCAVLLPHSGRAAGASCLGLSSGGTFSLNAGFWQAASPGEHGPAQLTISVTPDGEFQGLITILGNTYSITGEVDADGNLEFRSGHGRTGVRGEGKLQDLTRGGALLTGTYRLNSADKGTIYLLQKFSQPPDPPDIVGSWRGTFTNILCLLTGTLELMIQQDRTPNGTPGTGFTGQETLDTIIYDFVGTIDAAGNFVRIGVSDQGFLIDGGTFESGQLTGQSHVGSGTSSRINMVRWGAMSSYP